MGLLIVVGNLAMLKQAPTWRKLIEFGESKCAIKGVQDIPWRERAGSF
jgi:hypothetical protein